MPPKRRDPWLDNTKILLVTVVVVGHAIVLVPEDPLVSHTYDWIYYFHMPAFIVITGYLSRSMAWNRRYLTQVLTMLVVPYVVFEGAMAAFRIHVGGEEGLENLWLDPHWPMWYLIVLAMWRLVTPILTRHWLWIPASVLISIASGTVSVVWLDLDRFMGFLPFYVVGLYLTPEVLKWFHAKRAWVFGVVVLAVLWLLAGLTDDWIDTQWLYYKAAYDDLRVDPSEGALFRLALMCLSFVGGAAILTLVPHGRSWFTTMGKYTMVVYLLHGFFVRGARYAGYPDFLESHVAGSTLMLLLTAALAVGVSLLLAWQPLARWLMWLVDPINEAKAARRRRRESAPEAPTSA